MLLTSASNISIHAPRTGSDRLRRPCLGAAGHFNPRSPHGERPPCLIWKPTGSRISIHAPRTGSDHRDAFKPSHVCSFQSTLPARGAIRFYSLAQTHLLNFNPRSPHGERLLVCGACIFCEQGDFNPRSPHGERRFQIKQGYVPGKFQSTLPARGATRSGATQRRQFRHFNPRSPHGERRKLLATLSARSHFNPRSPHGERQTPSIRKGISMYFNPRSPHGERPMSVQRR